MFEKEIKILLKIVKTTKNADVVVKDLAEIQRDKKTTDLVRRKNAIEDKYGLKLEVKDLLEVYKEFQRVGWGTVRNRAVGVNAGFEWEIDYRGLCRAASPRFTIDTSKPAIAKRRAYGDTLNSSVSDHPVSRSRPNEVYVFALRSSGQTFKLNGAEVKELSGLLLRALE